MDIVLLDKVVYTCYSSPRSTTENGQGLDINLFHNCILFGGVEIIFLLP